MFFLTLNNYNFVNNKSWLQIKVFIFDIYIIDYTVSSSFILKQLWTNDGLFTFWKTFTLVSACHSSKHYNHNISNRWTISLQLDGLKSYCQLLWILTKNEWKLLWGWIFYLHFPIHSSSQRFNTFEVLIKDREWHLKIFQQSFSSLFSFPQLYIYIIQYCSKLWDH